MADSLAAIFSSSRIFGALIILLPLPDRHWCSKGDPPSFRDAIVITSVRVRASLDPACLQKGGKQSIPYGDQFEERRPFAWHQELQDFSLTVGRIRLHLRTFSPRSTSRRMASERVGMSGCFSAHLTIDARIAASARKPISGVMPVRGRPKALCFTAFALFMFFV
ncbi:MAG: hypothetical protein Q8M31_12010 [Beijerinckiaceae bacterium]|nr:hypothetical protein [Beijerinckiaceae bacterium]